MEMHFLWSFLSGSRLFYGDAFSLELFVGLQTILSFCRAPDYFMEMHFLWSFLSGSRLFYGDAFSLELFVRLQTIFKP
jgi:hypothetical protein